LYREVKRVAREREMSLAEVLRRGAEYIVHVYPPLESEAAKWKLPGPFDLGVRTDPFADPDWRVSANMGNSAAALVREKTARCATRRRAKK
jgi:hypothetical protein